MPDCPNCGSPEFRFGVCVDCQYANNGEGEYYCEECSLQLTEDAAEHHTNDHELTT